MFVFEDIEVNLTPEDAVDEAAARLSRDASPSSVASPSAFVNLPSPPNSERGAPAQMFVAQNVPERKQQQLPSVNTLDSSRPTSSWRDPSVSSLSGLLNGRKRLKLKM